MAYVSFEPLKAWIAQQEDYERRLGRPAPLTDNERLAMAVLVPPPPTPPPELPVRPDIDLGSVDCVSLLMRYVAAKKGVYDPPVFVDEPVESKPVRWRCRCTLPQEAPDRVFPGFDEDPKLSEFDRKKEAKQYAARRAVEWLMAQRHMPTDGVSVVFPASPKRPAPGFGVNGGGSRNGSSAGSSSPFARSRDATVSQKGSALGAPSLSSASSPSREAPSPLPAAAKPPTPDVVPRNNAAPPALPLSQQPPSSVQEEEAARPATAAPPTRNVESMASWRAAAPPAAAAETPPTEPAAATVVATGEKRPVDPPAASTPKNKRIRGSPRSNGGDNDQESMSNMEQLARLCEMFHLGTPQYELQSGQGDNVYSGSVTLTASAKHAKNSGSSPGADGADGRVIPLPPGVGVVRDIYLKRPAKEKMAQSVLQFLRMNVLQLSGEAGTV